MYSINSDFNATALDTLCDRYPDFSMLVHLQTEYKKKHMQLKIRILHIKLKTTLQATFLILVITISILLYIITQHTAKKDGSADDKYASISMDYRISSCNSYDELKIEYKNKTLSSVYKNTSCLSEMNVLIDFLENLVDAYISAFDS